MIKKIYILFIVFIASCQVPKTSGQKFYSLEKDTENRILHGPVKEIKQFGKIDPSLGLDREDDKYKYYAANAMGMRFDNGGNGWTKYDTLGMITWRQSLKDSINQKYYDTVKKHRMHIYNYEYDTEDVLDKLQYKQVKKFPWFVHNPYRVKIEEDFYQVYEMKVEKDSSYKKNKI